MTYVPYAPLWCWALQGEDAMFFSQPTETHLSLPAVVDPDGSLWLDTPTRYAFPRSGPCVARCQDESRFVLDDAAHDAACARGDWTTGLTPPIQCGQVARLDPDGRFLCDYHYARNWLCVRCQAPLPSPAWQIDTEDGFSYCSPPCQAEADAARPGPPPRRAPDAHHGHRHA